MIKIDKDELLTSVSELNEIIEDFQYLIDNLHKIEEEMDRTFQGKRVFPNMLEEVKTMLDDLEKLSVENISSFIEEVSSSFEDVDQDICKRVEQ